MDLSKVAYITVVVGSLAGHSWAAVQAAGTKSVGPRHEAQLKSEIQQCAQRVLCAGSVDDRVRCQEELCKKLLQAEDYDNAIRAAAAIQATQGANAERRAAHHFLIAQIYATQMEKSTNVEEAKSLRQRALQVAQEVVAQNYPASWGVTSEAQKLAAKLSDRKHLQSIQSGINKNEAGGVAPDVEALARQQAMAMEQSVKQNPSTGARGLLNRASAGLFGGRKGSPTVSVSDSGKCLRARFTGASSANGNKSAAADAAANASPSNRSPRKGGYGSSMVSFSRDANGKTVSRSANDVLPRGGALKSPIIIDGTSVRRAGTTARTQQ